MAGILPASVRGTSAPSARARKAVCCFAAAQVFSLQRAVEPAILRALDAGRAGFHVVLRVEVGAGHVGRAGGVHDGEMALVVERLEGGERGMQAKESVEIEDLVLRNRDAGAHGVVVLFAIGNDDVEAVGGAALKDDDEPAAGCGCRFQPGRSGRGSSGMAAVPAMASAPLWRKNRRFICMGCLHRLHAYPFGVMLPSGAETPASRAASPASNLILAFER